MEGEAGASPTSLRTGNFPPRNFLRRSVQVPPRGRGAGPRGPGDASTPSSAARARPGRGGGGSGGQTGAGWGTRLAPSPERGYGLRSLLLRTPPSSPRLGPALGWPGSPRAWGRQSVKEAGPGEAATCALKAASQRGTARAGGGGRNRGACEEGGGSPAFPPLPSRPTRSGAPLPSLQRRLSAGPGLLRVPPAGEVRGGSGSPGTGSAAEDGDYRGSAGMRSGPLPQGPPALLRLSSVPTSERSSGCSGGTPRRGGRGEAWQNLLLPQKIALFHLLGQPWR